MPAHHEFAKQQAENNDRATVDREAVLAGMREKCDRCVFYESETRCEFCGWPRPTTKEEADEPKP